MSMHVMEGSAFAMEGRFFSGLLERQEKIHLAHRFEGNTAAHVGMCLYS